MNPSAGAGDAALDPGRGAAWVDEHGAHLVDYASFHLEPARAVAAAASALTSCVGLERPDGVTDRAWLLSALRRECGVTPTGGPRPSGPGTGGAGTGFAGTGFAGTGGPGGFRPGPGPGVPDDGAVARAWLLADPAGAETLRLLYRHELVVADLARLQALSTREVGRLIARTQDVIEILVSGLDGIARSRPLCPEIEPLVAAVFPAGAGPEAAPGPARTALLTHIVTCSVCKRPINIRYTVPQIVSRPPIAPLTPQTRARLVEALRALPPARPVAQARPVTPGRPANPGRPAIPGSVTPARSVTPAPPEPPAAPRTGGHRPPPLAARKAGHRPPSSFGGAPLPAPVDAAPVRPSPATPAAPPVPATPAASAAPPAPTGQVAPHPPAAPARPQAGPSPAKPSAPAAGSPTAGSPTVGAPPVGSAAAVNGPFSAASVHGGRTGQETPLYDALLSQLRAREEARTRPGEPGLDAIPGAVMTPDLPAMSGSSTGLGEASGDEEGGRLPGAQVRIVTVLARVGSLVRATALRIVIVVVAGAAGTVAGINLLAPVFDHDGTPASLSSNVTNASGAPRNDTAGGGAVPDSASDGAPSGDSTSGGAVSGGAGPVATLEAVAAGGLQVPAALALDDFGRGRLTITATSGSTLKWRISAPGLVVTPSSGTLKPGHTGVISVRALRVRYWCGAPDQVSAPLELHGQKGTATTEVRWRTC
ncbi:hypothetical protein JOL79_30710 [Microbispora sp. RL4-1S]|uniref:Uncharacterized protein n=1 Tax=Microbispora oryzae TaxID=2806554 RepID=A0A940WWE9_9ACTN|nr:hypothetical protein [Microbispora oryzae]MBP2708159.1 hypothetical protein [Microbispora oryzae]